MKGRFIACLPDRLETGKYIADIRYTGEGKFNGKSFRVIRYLQEDLESHDDDVDGNTKFANRGLEQISDERFNSLEVLYQEACKIGSGMIPLCPPEIKSYIDRIWDKLTLLEELKIVG